MLMIFHNGSEAVPYIYICLREATNVFFSAVNTYTPSLRQRRLDFPKQRFIGNILFSCEKVTRMMVDHIPDQMNARWVCRVGRISKVSSAAYGSIEKRDIGVSLARKQFELNGCMES
jgi:hypothetical protein